MKKRLRSSIHHLKTGWYIWLFPLFAIGITGWLMWDYLKQQGPRVKIYFDDAASIQVEKTRVRFRGVPIGTVKDIYISDDQKDVIAEVLLRKDAIGFAVEGSKFSLVTPKVGFQGISGLQTLFEGTYIAVLPGPEGAARKTVFKAQASASTDPLDDTSAYLLETDNVESVNPGDSVTYRGVKIGTVTKMTFSKTAQTIHIQINVDNKYTRLVRANTVFWRKVGVQAKLGLFGSEIKVNSLDAIMNGGIEIATPNEAGPMAKALQSFPLVASAPKDAGKWNPRLE